MGLFGYEEIDFLGFYADAIGTYGSAYESAVDAYECVLGLLDDDLISAVGMYAAVAKICSTSA